MEPSEGLSSGACDGEAKAVPEMAQEVEAPVEPGREHGREMQGFLRRRVSTALSAKAGLIPDAITTRLLVTPPAVLTAGRGASSEAPAFSRRSWMRAFVYVDGFNLYYGALKGTPWKWLDPVALLERVL